MVMKILNIIFVFEIKESKITRGHNFTLVKKQIRLDVTLLVKVSVFPEDYQCME